MTGQSTGSATALDPKQVDAVILVGGQGTRLRPLTLSVPKPMLPTAGLPFLKMSYQRYQSVFRHGERAFRAGFTLGHHLSLIIAGRQMTEQGFSAAVSIQNQRDALKIHSVQAHRHHSPPARMVRVHHQEVHGVAHCFVNLLIASKHSRTGG